MVQEMSRRKGEVEQIDEAPERSFDMLQMLKDMLKAKDRPRPEDSILNSILDISITPAPLLYGPSKAGKTRLIVWEASTIAKHLDRQVLILHTESNIELEDITDMLYICAYHNVMCNIIRVKSLQGARNIVNKLHREYVTRYVKKKEMAGDIPRVFVLDSITSLSEMVLSTLNDDLLSNVPATISYQNTRQVSIIDPIRRILTDPKINGFLLATAHETVTRGVAYNPRVTLVKSKPRYVSAGKYKLDAEVYFADVLPEELRTCKATKSGEWKDKRGLIVVKNRREPNTEGRGVAISLSRVWGYTRGMLKTEDASGYSSYMFIPEDMAESESKTVQYNAIVPSIVCGPKNVA